jgi:SOS response regulatory protein OraA/RecX
MPSRKTANPQDSQALNAALRLLAHRPYSESELRQRLSRCFASQEAEATILHLKSQGYLDDGTFARSWRENRDFVAALVKSPHQKGYCLTYLGLINVVVQRNRQGQVFSDSVSGDAWT